MNLEKIPFDLFVTMPTGNEDFVETIKNDFSGAHVFEVPNWGRDVLPFLETATGVAELGYKYILKIHSKKSPQISQLKAQSKRFARVAEGRDWLTDILSKLMPDELGAVEEIMQKLQDPDTGVIGPAGHYIALPVGEQSWKVNKANLQKIVTQVFGKPTAQKISQSPWDYGLFQGTMFWARLDSLAPIFAAGFSVNNFEPERGQTDGTLAHAMERAFCLTPELIDKKMYEASKEGVKKIAYKTTKVPVWSEFYQP